MGVTTYAANIYLELQDICLAEGDFPEAERFGQEFFALHQRTYPTNQFKIGTDYYIHQANIACNKGELQEARQYCYLGLVLRPDQQHREPNEIFHLIPHLCQILVTTGDHELALELAVMAANWPALWKWQEKEISNLIIELESDLPPQVAAAARQRGRQRNFAATIDELIAAWKEDEDSSKISQK